MTAVHFDDAAGKVIVLGDENGGVRHLRGLRHALQRHGVLGLLEVEQAYRRSMSEFHPDRVSQSAAEIRELAERRTREANAAYDAIKRQRGR